MKHYLGIDLDASTIKAGVINEQGALIVRESIKTRADRKAHDIVRDMAYLAQKTIESSGIAIEEIASLGVGLTGATNNSTGMITYSPDLPLRHINLRAEIRRILPLPVYIENRANCRALAEAYFGAAKDAEHSIAMNFGAQVEGGTIINRRIYSGFCRGANGLGHFILEEGGEPCVCGKAGCFSAYASETALIGEMNKMAKRRPNSLLGGMMKNADGKTSVRLLFDAIRYDDEAAKAVLDRYLGVISLGLSNIIALLMPEVLILDGGFCEADESALTLIGEAVEKRKPCLPDAEKTKIRAPEIKNDAGVTGAAVLAMVSIQDGFRGE